MFSCTLPEAAPPLTPVVRRLWEWSQAEGPPIQSTQGKEPLHVATTSKTAATPAAKKTPAAKPAKLARKTAPAGQKNGTAPHQQFSHFMDEVLANPESRGAFEDASARATVAEAIIARRNELGMSQGQVAKLAGVNQAMISHLEAGTGMPLHAVQKVARALGGKLEIRFVH